MTMVIELAHFTIHEGAEEKLLAERPAMIDALRRRFPAFLTKEDDGTWLDVLLWRDRPAAEEAARLVDTVPECREWFRHIAESGGLRHVAVRDSWLAEDLAEPGVRGGVAAGVRVGGLAEGEPSSFG